MNSRQVLRVIHRAWSLHQNGEWSFERKTNDLGFPAIVRTSETFDSLERIVRSLYNLAIKTPISMTYRLPEWMLIPNGNNTPPITILETPDVQVMMAFADLTLCVTIGAEDVARYQFFCRADFNIGSTSYKFRNGNEDPSFEGFLGEAVIASQAMLEEYFNDEEMMVIHRVHLEMKKAKLDLENQRCYQLVHGNEIIVIDDTDSDSDRTERLESNKLSITVFNTGSSSNQESHFPTNGLIISDEINDVALDSEYIPQPNVSNDSPMEYYEGIPVQFDVDENLFPLIDDGISFWEGVIASENDNDVKDKEHSDEMDFDIPIFNKMAPPTLIMPTRRPTRLLISMNWENVSDNLLNTQPIYDNPVVSEGVLDDAIVIYNGETMPQNSANVDFIPATNNSPSISATVGLIPNPANADDNLVINLDDSSSEDSMHSGVTTNQHNELYVGMIFTNRNEFKLQMALYAINKKFRLRNIRPAPNGMLQLSVEGIRHKVKRLERLRDKKTRSHTHLLCGRLIRLSVSSYTSCCWRDDESVTPVIDTDDIIELTGQFSELDMLPPSTRHPPGRPRKKCFLSSGEVRMSTPLRVSLYHGAWQHNDDAYWIFQRKPSDLGYTVLVKLNESFKDLETIIRD
ncbi:hypothetical protein HID58_071102, partial [Brassica napus]